MNGHSTDADILEIVDAEDNVVGRTTRFEIHRQGLMHRAVHIFVFNSLGEIYIQRRSDAKDKHPGVLDSSAAGHVDPGESYDEAALRELFEELGVKTEIRPVLKLKASELTDMEHVALYEARTDDPMLPNEEEISWGGYMTPEELSQSMESNPTDFVPAFVHLWAQYGALQPQCRTQ